MGTMLKDNIKEWSKLCINTSDTHLYLSSIYTCVMQSDLAWLDTTPYDVKNSPTMSQNSSNDAAGSNSSWYFESNCNREQTPLLNLFSNVRLIKKPCHSPPAPQHPCFEWTPAGPVAGHYQWHPPTSAHTHNVTKWTTVSISDHYIHNWTSQFSTTSSLPTTVLQPPRTVPWGIDASHPLPQRIRGQVCKRNKLLPLLMAVYRRYASNGE